MRIEDFKLTEDITPTEDFAVTEDIASCEDNADKATTERRPQTDSDGKKEQGRAIGVVSPIIYLLSAGLSC